MPRPVTPHPLLQSPMLYVSNVPLWIGWDQLERMLSVCGPAYPGRPGAVARNSASCTWVVQFRTEQDAENALATLHGVHVSDPRSPSRHWQLKLSHSALHQSPYPPTDARILPQFLFVLNDIEPEPNEHRRTSHPFRDELSPQAIFKRFRLAGPLVSVRINFEVGIGPPTTVIEYWNEKDAEYARDHLPYLLGSMEKDVPPCILRTFDPRKLYFSDLNGLMGKGTLADVCSKNDDVQVTMLYSGAAALVSFGSHTDAAQALIRFLRMKIRNRKVAVKYFEPSQITPMASPNTSEEDNINSNSGEESDTYATAEEDTTEECRTERDAETTRTLRQRLEREYEAASKTEREAARLRRAAFERQKSAAQEHAKAKEVKESAWQRMQWLKMACEEAKKRWYALITQYDQATRDWQSVDAALSQASDVERTAAFEFEAAERQESRAKSHRAEIERKLNEARVAEYAHHNAGLAETIKRMEELRLREERDQAARQREEQAKARRREEERERYARAVRQEQERCKQRDARFFSANGPASWAAYANWLEVAGTDFDRVRFNNSQPLTTESIPWPIMRRPGCVDLSGVTWRAVDLFFKHLRTYEGAKVMSLLQATQRRFHPDRWKSRGLLPTVRDEQLKSELESAGMIVSQASNALIDEFQQYMS